MGTNVSHPPGAFRGAPVYVGTRELSYKRSGHIASAPAFTSTENFTPSNLAHEVRVQVANSEAVVPSSTQAPGPSGEQTAGPAKTGNRFGGTTIPRLEGCLSRIATGRAVVLAEVARYLGEPAAIVVLRPPTAGAAVFDVEVVALTCSASDSHIILQTTVSTP